MGCSSCNKKKIREQPRMPNNSSPRKSSSGKPSSGGMRSRNKRAKSILDNRKIGKLPTRPRKKLK